MKNSTRTVVRTAAISAIAIPAIFGTAIAANAATPATAPAPAQQVLTNANHTGHDIDVIVVFSDGTSAVKTIHNKQSFAAKGNFTGTDRLIVKDDAGDIFVAILSYNNGKWSTQQIPVSQGFKATWVKKTPGFDFRAA